MQNYQVIKLNSPRRLTILVVLAHAMGVAAIWLSALPTLWHFGLKIVLLASLVHGLWRMGVWGQRWRATMIRITPAAKNEMADQIEVTYADGRTIAGRLLEGSMVLPGLVVIAFRADNVHWWRHRFSLVLLADAASAEDLRQLRVRLKWGKAAAV